MGPIEGSSSLSGLRLHGWWSLRFLGVPIGAADPHARAPTAAPRFREVCDTVIGYKVRLASSVCASYFSGFLCLPALVLQGFVWAWGKRGGGVAARGRQKASATQGWNILLQSGSHQYRDLEHRR